MSVIREVKAQRKYFNEPLVRVKVGSLRFPRMCPVCSAPPTAITRITSKPTSKQWLRPYWNPSFYARDRRRFGLAAPETKSFLIYVCDEHYINDDGNARMRVLAMLFAAVLFSMSVFALIFTSNDISSGHGIHPLSILYFAGLTFSFGFGYFAFRPTPLEASVKIIGFDFDLQYVWLQLRNPQYRRIFLDENHANSEIVNWIIMA